MPRYSPLLNNLPQYPFAKVGRLSRDVGERDGIPVINARIGIPDEEASPTVKRLMSEYASQDKSTYGYPVDVHPSRGIDELVYAIIEDYRQKHGVELKPENIAVTGWTKDVLHNLPRLYARGNGVIPDPVYPAYEGATILAGSEIRRIPTSAERKWLPEVAFSSRDRFLYFCDPNNPTGSVADITFYERLLGEIRAYDVGGIFDKAYKDFTFDEDTRPVSITQVPELMDYGYEVVSFSKHHNFVGIGLGWIVSSPENINRWTKLSDQFGQGVPWYHQKAGVVALTNQEAKQEIAEYMGRLKNRRDVFAGGLRRLGLECEPPQATPYLWVKVPEGYDDEDFVLNTLLNKAHVAFMPGSYFGDSGKGYLRATVYVSESNIAEALERIEAIRDW